MPDAPGTVADLARALPELFPAVDGTDGFPPSTSGALTRLAVARAVQAGLDVPALLARAGIDARHVADPGRRIVAAKQVALLNFVAAGLPDAMLGFHLAKSFELRRLGLLYYVMASAANLREAIERGERYSAIADESIVPKCRFTADAVAIDLSYVGVSRHHDRHEIQFWITTIVRMLRALTGRDLRPEAVHLIHARHSESWKLERFIGQDIAYESGHDGIRFATGGLDAPVCESDSFLQDLLLRYCEDALGDRGRPLELCRTRVENAIAPRLPHGRARIGEVAKALGMTPRTLSRRLAQEGVSFAGVLTSMRQHLARHYLRHTAMPLSQVAWLVGYQDVSAFTHAFRRWTGRSPGAVRLEHAASGPSALPAARARARPTAT